MRKKLKISAFSIVLIFILLVPIVSIFSVYTNNNSQINAGIPNKDDQMSDLRTSDNKYIYNIVKSVQDSEFVCWEYFWGSGSVSRLPNPLSGWSEIDGDGNTYSYYLDSWIWQSLIESKERHYFDAMYADLPILDIQIELSHFFKAGTSNNGGEIKILNFNSGQWEVLRAISSQSNYVKYFFDSSDLSDPVLEHYINNQGYIEIELYHYNWHMMTLLWGIIPFREPCTIKAATDLATVKVIYESNYPIAIVSPRGSNIRYEMEENIVIDYMTAIDPSRNVSMEYSLDGQVPLSLPIDSKIPIPEIGEHTLQIIGYDSIGTSYLSKIANFNVILYTYTGGILPVDHSDLSSPEYYSKNHPEPPYGWSENDGDELTYTYHYEPYPWQGGITNKERHYFYTEPDKHEGKVIRDIRIELSHTFKAGTSRKGGDIKIRNFYNSQWEILQALSGTRYSFDSSDLSDPVLEHYVNEEGFLEIEIYHYNWDKWDFIIRYPPYITATTDLATVEIFYGNYESNHPITIKSPKGTNILYNDIYVQSPTDLLICYETSREAPVFKSMEYSLDGQKPLPLSRSTIIQKPSAGEHTIQVIGYDWRGFKYISDVSEFYICGPETPPGVLGAPPVIERRDDYYVSVYHWIYCDSQYDPYNYNYYEKGFITKTGLAHELHLDGPKRTTYCSYTGLPPKDPPAEDTYTKNIDLNFDVIIAYIPIAIVRSEPFYSHTFTLSSSTTRTSEFSHSLELGIRRGFFTQATVYSGGSETKIRSDASSIITTAEGGETKVIYVRMTFIHVFGSITYWNDEVREYDVVACEHISYDLPAHEEIYAEGVEPKELPVINTIWHDGDSDGRPDECRGRMSSFIRSWSETKRYTKKFGINLGCKLNIPPQNQFFIALGKNNPGALFSFYIRANINTIITNDETLELIHTFIPTIEGYNPDDYYEHYKLGYDNAYSFNFHLFN